MLARRSMTLKSCVVSWWCQDGMNFHSLCLDYLRRSYSKHVFFSVWVSGVLFHTHVNMCIMKCRVLNLQVHCRVVNITLLAILVLPPIVSAMLFEYWCKYRRYLSYAVLVWASVMLFHLFFISIRYQYFCHQVHYLSLSTTLLWLSKNWDCSLASKVDTATLLTHEYHVTVNYNDFDISRQQPFY